MSVPVITVDVVISHVQHTAAEIVFVSFEDAGLQPCRYGEGLKSGTRLIGIADAEIIPHGVQDLQLFLVGHGVDLLFCVILCQVSWLVQVIIGVGCFRQDLAVLRIHDHNGCIFTSFSCGNLIFVLFIKFQDVLFHDTLNLQVNGGHYSIAVHRFLYGLLHCGGVIQIAIFPAVGAVQNAVVGSLDPVASHISVYRKSDHIAGQCIIGIGPYIVFLQPDPFHIRILFRILFNVPEFFVCFIVYAFFQDIVPAVRLFLHQVSDFLLVNLKTVLQHLDGGFDLIFIAQHGLHIQDHIVHTLAGSHLRAVPVYNIAPLKRDGPAVILLLIQDDPGIIFAICRIDICNSSN